MTTEHTVDYSLAMTEEGWALLTWHDNDGEKVDVELNIESPEVKEALALIRKVIWG